MAEQTRTGLVPGFIKLSLLATIGAALGGLGGCSSSGSEAPGSNGSQLTADGSVGCTTDPRAEDFTPNLTHKGDSGMLSFVIVSANDNPPAVDDNTWRLKILDANGQAVKDAVLSFPATVHPSDPWMPDHSHGALPAKAVNNNDGTYTIAPLYFFMGGIWSTYIQANVGSVTDSTTFTFCVNT